jgi:hypothetical protein
MSISSCGGRSLAAALSSCGLSLQQVVTLFTSTTLLHLDLLSSSDPFSLQRPSDPLCPPFHPQNSRIEAPSISIPLFGSTSAIMSDNDLLDAELLALAGDDSSDDERTDNRAAQRSSPFGNAAMSSEPDRSPPPRRGLAQKPNSRTSAAASRRRRKDDSEEEGEA